ncbi:MAG: ChuX/HutX family heme-like substrate-binding protein [Thiomonas sp.]|uniref:hemin-degrading factor n=1 Tax=Thiomonas sp. TaxID=2047785 RepID=UPI002A369E01|nr:ChuX/HutX family heme-like substrate-binding protein [Thiomonas sp.]MDY0329487.1 ChuX/HutX family heme-like substrate-binding protein [Thiomonas sp.]
MSIEMTTPPTDRPADPVHTTEALRDAYAQARSGTPTLRQRDIAAQLGCSEGEIVAAHVGEPEGGALSALRLQPRWRELFHAFESLGDVMALTRNTSCVHEKTGTYRNVTCTDRRGLVLDRQIDLRLFFSRWTHGFAVNENGSGGPRQSLQFYDAQGQALHKIHARPATDLKAWQGLIEQFRDPQQQAGMQPEPAPPAEVERDDGDIDVAQLREEWAGLRDTHEFFGLLKRHGLTRTQALRLADPRYAIEVERDVLPRMLQDAARDAVPIMVFVGNPGIIQIHSGAVRKIVPMGPWINVLDPDFNLHLRQDHVARAWVVRKPTRDGIVTSLELFDAAGQTIAMLFGERRPGIPEIEPWKNLMDHVAKEKALCAA